MNPNPFIGVIFHWIGGLAAASFYLPFKRVRRWSWETYWLVGGIASWIIAPPLFAALLVPDFWSLIRGSAGETLAWTFMFGLIWGVGGLTFGLTVRYLGLALGYAVALGCCAAFGTLIPPIFNGELGKIASSTGGQITLGGIGICLVGIVVSGIAGMSKERELSAEQKAATVREFNFPKGLVIAIFCGIASAAMAFALAAGKPIANAARDHLVAGGRLDIWQNLPVLVVVLWGGFLTNFIWCVILNLKNRTGHEYLATTSAVSEEAAQSTDAHGVATAIAAPAIALHTARVPLIANYILSALAGLIWYLQFFFYSMGETKMGKFGFSSWTLHMASIIIFSTLWGIALKEWKGTSKRTHALIACGLAILIFSTIIVGYGNYVRSLAN